MLNDTEAAGLNEAVAKILGHEPRRFFVGASPAMGRPEDMTLLSYPDFARDPLAFGHLLRRLGELTQPAQFGGTEPLDWQLLCCHAEGEITYSANVGWQYLSARIAWLATEDGDTPGEAVCRAILKYAEREKTNVE